MLCVGDSFFVVGYFLCVDKFVVLGYCLGGEV